MPGPEDSEGEGKKSKSEGGVSFAYGEGSDEEDDHVLESRAVRAVWGEVRRGAQSRNDRSEACEEIK